MSTISSRAGGSKKSRGRRVRRGSVLQAPKRDATITDSIHQYHCQQQQELFLRHHKNQSERTRSKIEPNPDTKSLLSSQQHEFKNTSKSNTDKTELDILRNKQELLHCLLPKEIVNSIHHHWYSGIDDAAQDLRRSTSSSSWGNNTIPSSIIAYQHQENHDQIDDIAILDKSNRTISSVDTNASRALYNEDAQDVTIIFIDIVGFSAIANEIPPSEVMNMLQDLFQRFDSICKNHKIQKIDTIGDAYLCSAGFFNEHANDSKYSNDQGRSWALRALAASKEMVRESREVPVPQSSSYASKEDGYVSVRIGIHVGDATFGVLGQSLPKLICVGSTVNMAARMEQTSSANMIHVTNTFHDLIGDKEDGWECSKKVMMKNIGEIDAYLLDPMKKDNESCWC